MVGDLIWLSVLMPNFQINFSLANSLMVASLTLSVATNAFTTIMIAYKLWTSLWVGSLAHHEIILQELPHIRREDSQLESKEESSANNINSSRRIRCCLPRIPGQ